VQRAGAGDTGAFEALYREHSPRVFALCLRLTGWDQEAATSLLQDTFISAWRGLPGFRGESPFATWLHRLAVNAMLQNVRTDRRREARVLPVEDPGANGAHARTEDGAALIDIERAIARLPEGARVAFVLHYIDGLQYQEIAAQLGVAVGTVKAQVHRARQLLARSLER
jgi:RNA polymerase sigma factor (sigma-70 family)